MVNEKTEDEVQSLREQIRQLKVRILSKHWNNRQCKSFLPFIVAMDKKYNLGHD